MGVHRLQLSSWRGAILIVTKNQAELRYWLCNRIGLVPTPNMVCIGIIGADETIKGVVGFDGFNGASVQMHSAGEGNWITRDLLWACFDYPFRVCELNMVIGLVPSGNERAVRFNEHVGFKKAYVLEGAHPDGSLVLMTMTRQECRYLDRKRHGQKIYSSSARES